MGVTLLVIGLLMNVVGVILSSSRDLAGLWIGWTAAVTAGHRVAYGWLRRKWAAITRRRVDARVQAVSGSASASFGGSGTVFVWNTAPDGMDLETAIARFRDRTDNLHDMVSFEATRRAEEDAQLSVRLEELATSLTSSVEALEERVHDFDVKPAGQRAIGALLVVGGTFLMFAGGLVG